MKSDNANIQFFLQRYGILSLPMRIAAAFADDYGIFGGARWSAGWHFHGRNQNGIKRH